jgi:hypothetical protein
LLLLLLMMMMMMMMKWRLPALLFLLCWLCGSLLRSSRIGASPVPHPAAGRLRGRVLRPDTGQLWLRRLVLTRSRIGPPGALRQRLRCRRLLGRCVCRLRGRRGRRLGGPLAWPTSARVRAAGAPAPALGGQG